MEECNTHKVDDPSGNLDQKHLERQVIDLSVDIQQLDDYQRGECDGYYVRIGVIEQKDTQHNDGTTLEDALPDPDTEGFEIQIAAFL